MARFKVFVSYSHKDDRWLESVREHLGVLESGGLIDVFADTRIAAGEEWFTRLHQEMLVARLALLLVSASFLRSSFIGNEEVPRIFQQHETDGMTIYPLLVRDCAWQEVDWLAKLQIRPPNAKSLGSMRGAAREACLANVAREVATIVKAEDQFRTRMSPSPSDSRAALSVGDLDVLRRIASARGQRTSGELLAHAVGSGRAAEALVTLERAGLIRRFTIDRGTRFTVADPGRKLLAEKGLL